MARSTEKLMITTYSRDRWHGSALVFAILFASGGRLVCSGDCALALD